jgi:hypothetical protein
VCPSDNGQYLRLPENVILLRKDFGNRLIKSATEDELVDMVVDVLRRNGSNTI